MVVVVILLEFADLRINARITSYNVCYTKLLRHDGVAATGKPLLHIPTTQDCSACHNPTAFAGALFDHRGTVDNCVQCHNGDIAMGKHSNHVPTNGDCSQCHVTTGFVPATFNHFGIVDNCQSCHNGVFAQGKTPDHIQTNQDS